MYVCSVIAKQLEFYNSVSQVSSYTGYIPVQLQYGNENIKRAIKY